MKIHEVLSKIQSELVAPKNNFNAFGKYNYRSCEDILEGLKKPLAKYGAAVVLEDDIRQVGNRIYIEATVKLLYNGEEITSRALAREAESKKGMDESQITGSASSYARKYALNGLFAIDDEKDADTRKPEENESNISQREIDKFEKLIQEKGKDREKILSFYKVSSPEELTKSQFKNFEEKMK